MITPYSHTMHYEMLKTWLTVRSMPTPEKDMFSDLGFCVDNTAIGFLFLTNSKQAYIDNIAANPEKSVNQRDRCINALINTLEAAARENGYKVVSVLANIPTMKKRFAWRGFRKHDDYSLFYKFIGG